MNISKAQCSRYFSQLLEMEYIVSVNGGNLRKVSYKIDYWDNYQAIREKIKRHLTSQLEALKNRQI